MRFITLLERIWVDPQYRGRGLALRLMREAKHLLGRFGLLVILKAHPDGDKVTGKSLLALASYYQRDKHLGLQPLSKQKLPGWLVAHWDAPEATKGDVSYWVDERDETS